MTIQLRRGQTGIRTRLHDKGLLARRKEGKRYLYSPRLTREEFVLETARDVLAGLEDARSRQAIALLADSVSEASAEDLDALERLIRRRRRELAS